VKVDIAERVLNHTRDAPEKSQKHRADIHGGWA